MTLKRLTTDNPKGILESLMNFAYAKNNKVYLSYADEKDDVDLCEYVSKLAQAKGFDFSPEFIMEDGLFDNYDDDFAVLYYLAIQAAELREQLKLYEDKFENGTLIELPCNIGDKIYHIIRESYIVEESIYQVRIYEDKHIAFSASRKGGRVVFNEDELGKTVFLTREQAQAKLEELKDE